MSFTFKGITFTHEEGKLSGLRSYLENAGEDISRDNWEEIDRALTFADQNPSRSGRFDLYIDGMNHEYYVTRNT
ncbi:MAG: hypothetical protein ACK4FA_01200, partial [Candidatus Paceibacteria bacterium]